VGFIALCRWCHSPLAIMLNFWEQTMCRDAQVPWWVPWWVLLVSAVGGCYCWVILVLLVGLLVGALVWGCW
jgi:hypothetical protein